MGVFGGTFDPLHVGHLQVADYAREEIGLDRVLFVPAARPWLKNRRPLANVQHRVAMVRHGIVGNEYFQLSEREVYRAGPSYTVDTLAELKEDLGPRGELYLVVGMDALRGITEWHEARRLFDMATVVGMARQGRKEVKGSVLEQVGEDSFKRTVSIDGPSVGISSTEIRKRVANGRSIRHMVPLGVEDYIYEKGLYKD